MSLTFDELSNKLLDNKNQWKQPYKYLVLKNLLENYPNPQKKSDIINSSQKLKKADESDIQTFWLDLYNDGFCDDYNNNNTWSINVVDDFTTHQKYHLSHICDKRIDGVNSTKINLHESCVDVIKELSGLDENQFQYQRIPILNCSKVLDHLNNPDTRDKAIQILINTNDKAKKPQDVRSTPQPSNKNLKHARPVWEKDLASRKKYPIPPTRNESDPILKDEKIINAIIEETNSLLHNPRLKYKDECLYSSNSCKICKNSIDQGSPIFYVPSPNGSQMHSECNSVLKQIEKNFPENNKNIGNSPLMKKIISELIIDHLTDLAERESTVSTSHVSSNCTFCGSYIEANSGMKILGDDKTHLHIECHERLKNIKPKEVGIKFVAEYFNQKISENNDSSEKIKTSHLPTEYRTLNITDHVNRVKRNQGVKKEDFENLIFEGIKDKDKEALRNKSIAISVLIFDISENGSIRLFGTGKLITDTVIENRLNRHKKDEITIKVVDFSSFSSNENEAMPILPELKNFSLKKYFSGNVNYIDSAEVYQELIDEVEINPSKDIKPETIPEETDGVGNSVEHEAETEHESVMEHDPELKFPTNMEDKIKEIQKNIIVDKDIIYQIASNLIAGKNILLVGPVGSGKTDLSQKISKILWRDEEFEGFYSKGFTAHSEWTIADVMGGIAPKISNDESDKVEFTFNPGCVVETVSDNWVGGDSTSNQRKVMIDDNEKKYRGTWLLIDEFNRASIDKSFGEMFTAIEYGKLTISDNTGDKLTRELKIPKNYRIIGTLNSTDKHFLETISNALKRRFAMIEISYPKYGKKDTELYHIIKKSIKGLDLPEIEESLDHQKQKYSQDGDVEVDKIIENLYNIIFFVRQMKPLGTSILIGILKTFFTEKLLKNSSTKEELEEILDNCLRSQLVPQFEDLKTKELELLNFFFSMKRLAGFHKKYIEDAENSPDEFRIITNFIGAKTQKKLKTIRNALRNENLGEMQSVFEDYWAEKGTRPNMRKTIRSIEEMLKERGILEEETFEDSPNEE